MCEIQYLKKIDGKNISKKEINTFIRFMNLGNMENNHAFGVFNSKGMFKYPNGFDYKKIDDSFILSDNFIVGHNRHGTNKYNYIPSKEDNGGIIKDNPFFAINTNSEGMILNFLRYKIPQMIYKEDKKRIGNKKVLKKEKLQKKEIPFNDNINNHPFSIGDFILVHNGIISNDEELKEKYHVKTEITTDSYMILWLIDKYLKESKLDNRREKIVESIKKAIGEIQGGYSVILYDKESGDMFYFKNFMTSFTFKKVGNLLMGSTAKENFNIVYGESKKDKDFFTPKSKVIYLISGYPIKRLGTLDDVLQKEDSKGVKGGKK